MASASTLTSIAYALKKLYASKRPENLAARDRVFLSMVKKEGGFVGKDLTVAVQYGNPQGVGGVFSNAQANAASSKGIAWTVTRARKYGFATIDAETIESTKDDQGAFIRALRNEVDGMLDEMGHRMAIELYNDGTNVIGQVSSVSSNTVTLTDADKVKNFSVGMKLIVSANTDGSSPRASGATSTVTAIDEDNGTVTVDSLQASTTANDYLFMDGDTSTQGAVSMKGLAAHLPLTAPTNGDSFYGVDRSVDVGRLSGWRVNNTSAPIEENAMTLSAKIQRAGGRPDALFLNPPNWANLSKALGSKVIRDPGGDGTFGFEYIQMATPAGMVKVYSDPECPSNRGYMLEMRSWMLKYLGPSIPHIVMDDGLESLRQSSSDGVEVRGRLWGNLYCTAPGHNGVFAI